MKLDFELDCLKSRSALNEVITGPTLSLIAISNQLISMNDLNLATTYGTYVLIIDKGIVNTCQQMGAVAAFGHPVL